MTEDNHEDTSCLHSPIIQSGEVFESKTVRPGVCKLFDGIELGWKIETGTMALFWNLVNDAKAYLDRFVSLNKALLLYNQLMNNQ